MRELIDDLDHICTDDAGWQIVVVTSADMRAILTTSLDHAVRKEIADSGMLRPAVRRIASGKAYEGDVEET